MVGSDPVMQTFKGNSKTDSNMLDTGGYFENFHRNLQYVLSHLHDINKVLPACLATY
jgi:hypothetical protein